MDRVTFTHADEAYIEANHQRAADPDAYDAWAEEMQEQQDQARTRGKLKQPPRKMRQYK